MMDGDPTNRADKPTLDRIQFILERAFEREGGQEPDEMDIQYFRALADAARKEAEGYERLAEDLFDVADQSEMRFDQTRNFNDREVMANQRQEAENFSHQALLLHAKADELLRHIANYDSDTW
jgi:hypothetical protein